jgi:RNA polymerase sigma-70 factor (sigma-E family)
MATEGGLVRRTNRFEGLDAFVASRGQALLASAVFLGGSRAAGEDLLQAALERLMLKWHRVRGDPEGYLRQILYRMAVDEWRRRRRRVEVPLDVEPAGEADRTANLHLRQLLVQELASLPPRQRAVLVLRYWEQLSEAEAAATLGCSVGTIKSTASRALARLRERSADWAAETTATRNG